jgi:hypothetical protein
MFQHFANHAFTRADVACQSNDVFASPATHKLYSIFPKEYRQESANIVD